MKYQICLSGSSSRSTSDHLNRLAFEIGKEIAKQGQTLVTGATVGLPHYSVIGFKSVNNATGLTVGFSPASSYREHISVYKLPIKEFDYIHYTGMAYVGRDTQLVRSSDAVIVVGGRMGSLHELTTAIESRKVIGVLIGSGGVADYIQEMIKNIDSPHMNIIFEADPRQLVAKVVMAINKKYQDLHN